MVERYIGVDLGTTASAIHFTDRLEGNLLQSRTLIFPGGEQKYVPTVIYEPANTEETLYGWDAEARVIDDPERVRLGFKMALLDPNRRKEAERCIRIFYKYMYQVYQKKADKIPGQDYDEEHTFTLVTYPAKFSDDQQRVLEKAAKDAGFPNVTMLSEAEAAMWYAVSTENEEVRSIFSALNKKPLSVWEPNILTVMSVDMGAGTTDVTIFEYDYRKRCLIYNYWIKNLISALGVRGLLLDSGINFGGRAIDQSLLDFYAQQLGRGIYETIGGGDVEYGERILLHNVRIFKETTVSEMLNKGQEVPYPPGILFQAAAIQGASNAVSIDRNRFEKILGDYLRQFSLLIEHTLKIQGRRREDIDLVVLTGGNSGWYFVDETLCDPDGPLALKALNVDGKAVLPLIRFPGDERIAVAIGAAMSLKIAEELYELGENYSYDRPGVSQDYEEAVKWYRKSAEQGYAVAQCHLGYCYKSGQGVDQDYAEAVKWYRKSAEQGDAPAQYHLGYCYEHGQGVAQDYAEAVKWYRMSAEQGYDMAQVRLALCYEYGRGVAQNFIKAAKWDRKSFIRMGRSLHYLWDLQFGQMIKWYRTWYRTSAEQGDAMAQYALGCCYCYRNCSWNVDLDCAEAIKWYRKSAEQGHAGAQCDLGNCYECGYVTRDYAEAIKWYRRSAEQGYAPAQYSLGRCYVRDYGDYIEAVKWYRKSAEQGYAVAQYYLGCCYYNEQGVAKDYAEAVKWYRKSAEQGNVYAQYNLGLCYANGRGVSQDYAEAFKWYRKSAEQGYADALCKLRELL